MAGNFRIDVVVSGGAATGNGSSIPTSAASAALITGAGLSAGEVARRTGVRTAFGDPNAFVNENVLLKDGVETSVAKFNSPFADKILYDKSKLQRFGTRRFHKGSFDRPDDIAGSIEEEVDTTRETAFGAIVREAGFDPEFSPNYKETMARTRALTSAAMAKTVYATVQYAQHTSGDSYYNQQLSNMMKLGGYGILLANSGPAAPFVAAGIVVNEGIQAVLDFSKFQFDRKMEAYEITNNLIIAGNASYGRMRGVGV
jgi:hypothetical protein